MATRSVVADLDVVVEDSKPDVGAVKRTRKIPTTRFVAVAAYA